MGRAITLLGARENISITSRSFPAGRDYCGDRVFRVGKSTPVNESLYRALAQTLPLAGRARPLTSDFPGTGY